MPLEDTEIASMRAGLKADGVSDDEIEYILALAVRIKRLPFIATQRQYDQLKSDLRDVLRTMSAHEFELIGDSTQSNALYCHALLSRLYEWLDATGLKDPEIDLALSSVATRKSPR